jgi:adenine-specific DNA-methyltransferase
LSDEYYSPPDKATVYRYLQVFKAIFEKCGHIAHYKMMMTLHQKQTREKNKVDKLKMQTPDLTAENVAKLSTLFPGVVADGKVNVDLLRSHVGEEIFGDEAYEFTWVGKRAAIAEAGRPIRKTLRPCPEESRDWDTTENLYIEGDNLDVLKLLQESYLGKVKMIYIDPPYNTGADFVYRDNFTASREDYEGEAGVYDEDGDRLFRNTETNGRFHSDWCSMIYPRLVLARNLLRDDGCIFISVDDNEVAQCRKICDEVFGVINFICEFIWHSRQNKDNRNINGVSIDHEYILCYSKKEDVRLFVGTERKTDIYTNSDNDARGDWASANMVGLATADARPNLHYDLINPETGINYGCPAKGWRYDKKSMLSLILDNRIIWPENPDGRPRKKSFLNELSDNLPGFSSMIEDGIYTNTATKEQKKLFEGHWFDFPKPSILIKKLASQTSQNNDLILDFFSGSATTAHAVMQLNAEDGGRRKFIMVQLPEGCSKDSEAAKAGYANICEIGKERIRRAGDKIQAENDKLRNVPFIKNEEEIALFVAAAHARGTKCVEQIEPLFEQVDASRKLDTGFRVLKLDSTNMNDVYYTATDYTQDMLLLMQDNIKPDRSGLDLLFGCLLDWGLPLSMPHTHEVIDGATVHTYNNGDLIACFAAAVSETVVREIAGRQPLRAVFRDSSFTSSPEKINVTEIFKLLAPNTTVRVI